MLGSELGAPWVAHPVVSRGCRDGEAGSRSSQPVVVTRLPPPVGTCGWSVELLVIITTFLTNQYLPSNVQHLPLKRRIAVLGAHLFTRTGLAPGRGRGGWVFARGRPFGVG